ncbi:hypothetical protein [Ruminococcus sp.]
MVSYNAHVMDCITEMESALGNEAKSKANKYKEEYNMKIFMIGGTGLLGSEAAKVLISRGHEVTAMALPPLPDGAILPTEMKIEYGNYLEMSDDELCKHLTGCDGFVFAAGVDERVEGPRAHL